MKNKISYIIKTLSKPIFRWFLIFWACITLAATISGVYTNQALIVLPDENIPTDENIWPIENTKNHEIIISWPFIFQNDEFNIANYPSIQINKKIEGWFIEFDVDPYSWLADRSSYLKSKNYFFAFRFFIGNIENGWYYQVFRKENWWVANDRDFNLMWAISGEEFRDWNTWIIPISDKVTFAKEKGQFGYKYVDILGYINSSIDKTLKIGGFTSSVSEEPNWWKLNKINSIKIKYIGDKDAITLK